MSAKNPQDEEDHSFLEEFQYETNNKQPKPRRWQWLRSSALPWTLVTILCIYTATSRILPSFSTHDLWTSTDFFPARKSIVLTEVKFSSSLDWLDEERIVRISDPLQPVYIGNDTGNIDREWHKIIYPADLPLSDEETKYVGGKLQRNPVSGKFTIELEVFHSLHCLNMVRKRVYSELYPEMLTDNARIHVDHCIESLRELIMCEGNMTPIPLEWSEKGKRMNPNYSTTHSCRNFNMLKDYAVERSQSGA
ncbi:uncharacterized protein L3040_002794 [Drepanopeziza brunnea f. sp. 'multigermtubi']|uniref:uncharacterized protein n=1 Tax=Drepanopeziza brunnea f. sp. 'multigermtubi' TaxID=698441 RepID=UPI0023A5E624|nr:hypothetical protein L3040_002794 [Drepanopeziza brunnea f. sp. 'multigermtubi']